MRSILQKYNSEDQLYIMNRIPNNININYPIMIRDSFNNRISCDHYATPINTIQKLLDNINIFEYNNILEPSAGEGNIIKAIRDIGYNGEITAIELRHIENQSLYKYTDNIIIGDFLTFQTDIKYDLIIGNPPFNKALEFLENCFNLISENGKIIMLLRTAFLESKARYDFWQKHPLSKLYVLSQRPSFTGKGTDATSYSWMVFEKNTSAQEIKVI